MITERQTAINVNRRYLKLAVYSIIINNQSLQRQNLVVCINNLLNVEIVLKLI